MREMAKLFASRQLLLDTFNALDVCLTDKSNLKCSLIISAIFSIFIFLISNPKNSIFEVYKFRKSHLLNLILIIGFYLLVSGLRPFYCPVELRFCVRPHSDIGVQFRPIFALLKQLPLYYIYIMERHCYVFSLFYQKHY